MASLNQLSTRKIIQKKPSPIVRGWPHLIKVSFYPALMGSKTPTSKFSESKEVRWGINCP
ncbi:hypothetical protein GJV13_06495 [Bacillus sp. RIT694]|nr:hypothetical protein DN393_07560 [Bacillus sp. BPN334]MRS23459.1 hypothetical protein [Bacillus sp. RIT694]